VRSNPEQTAKPAREAVPGFFERASFFVRSNGLKAREFARSRPAPPLRIGSEIDFPLVLVESRTPLIPAHDDHPMFVCGKIQNLRLACARIHRKTVARGQEFRFWREIGPPWALRGYVTGREIREGCVIPTIGGGLCQLSGSLHEVALGAGCRITERNRHTYRLAGVDLPDRRDATVFWNYVDLRWVAERDVLLEAYLEPDTLVVRLRGRDLPANASREDAPAASAPARALNNCYECGQHNCPRSVAAEKSARRKEERSSAALLEAFQPEILRAAGSPDRIFVPRRSAYGSRARSFDFTSYRSALAWRLRAGKKIAATQAIERAADLARAYSRALPSTCDTLFVTQDLAPHLWRLGALGGRRYRIFLQRPSFADMHDRLDRAALLYPEAELLREFRAPVDLVADELHALAHAAELITAHADLARAFHLPSPAPWIAPVTTPATLAGTRDSLLFPGPTAAREGAFAVRELARATGLKVLALGPNLEGPGFWTEVEAPACTRDTIPWERVTALVHPTLHESWPRLHLEALARGIPVIATAACGLPASPGLRIVSFGERLPSENFL
jgi:VanW like protein